jgi:hypothetical protein
MPAALQSIDMVRKLVAAAVGVTTAILTVVASQWLSHRLFPPPENLASADSAALAAYIANAPVAALLIVLFGYILATFDGTLIACLIGRARASAYALLIGLLMLVATISNLIMIPHPLWFSATALLGIVIAAWAATQCLPPGNDLDHPAR